MTISGRTVGIPVCRAKSRIFSWIEMLKVSAYQSADGQLFISRSECKRYESGNLPFVCPKCAGEGHETIGPIMGSRKYIDEAATRALAEEESFGGGRSCTPVYRREIVGWLEKDCDVCNGAGWTAIERKPITETHTTITGYK